MTSIILISSILLILVISLVVFYIVKKNIKENAGEPLAYRKPGWLDGGSIA